MLGRYVRETQEQERMTEVDETVERRFLQELRRQLAGWRDKIAADLSAGGYNDELAGHIWCPDNLAQELEAR